MWNIDLPLTWRNGDSLFTDDVLPDPDLEIRPGGWGGGGTFGPQFGLKIRRVAAPPGPSRGSATMMVPFTLAPPLRLLLRISGNFLIGRHGLKIIQRSQDTGLLVLDKSCPAV